MRVIPVAYPAVCDLLQSYMTYSDALFVVGVVVVVVEKKPRVGVSVCKRKGTFQGIPQRPGPSALPSGQPNHVVSVDTAHSSGPGAFLNLEL